MNLNDQKYLHTSLNYAFDIPRFLLLFSGFKIFTVLRNQATYNLFFVSISVNKVINLKIKVCSCYSSPNFPANIDYRPISIFTSASSLNIWSAFKFVRQISHISNKILLHSSKLTWAYCYLQISLTLYLSMFCNSLPLLSINSYCYICSLSCYLCSYLCYLCSYLWFLSISSS